jgi:hypothetical protein
VPGHGEAYTDKAKIDYYQAYLRDVWTAVSALKQQGLSAEEAARRADMSKHKERFPNPAVPVLAAQRIYQLIDASRSHHGPGGAAESACQQTGVIFDTSRH